MRPTTVVSWVGVTDLRHHGGEIEGSPLAAVVQEVAPRSITILWNDSEKTPGSKIREYTDWLSSQARSGAPRPEVRIHEATGPDGCVMDFAWAYEHSEAVLRGLPSGSPIAVNASSGTPIMTAAWIVCSKLARVVDCQLYISSREQGVRKLALPDELRIDLRGLFRESRDDYFLNYIADDPDAWARNPTKEKLIGNSNAMKRIRAQVAIVAPYDVPVLITGGPGTGKSVLARLLHDLGGRGEESFVTVDCSFLGEKTEQYSLFGWRKGSHSTAKDDRPGQIVGANGGTLFLDEIGNATAGVQTALLRLLQTKKYRPLGAVAEETSTARIVAATNSDLDTAIRSGTFRQDLLDRLRAVHIHLPPLIDRGRDIVGLAKDKLAAFQAKHSEQMKQAKNKKKTLSPSAEKVLLNYDWPGNVRELEHVVARLVIFGRKDNETIDGPDVERELLSGTAARADSLLDRQLSGDFSLEMVLRELKWHYVRRAAREAAGNKTQMARLLGYKGSRTPLNTMLNEFKEAGLNDPLVE